MKRNRLTENKLKNFIRECVKQSLYEERFTDTDYQSDERIIYNGFYDRDDNLIELDDHNISYTFIEDGDGMMERALFVLDTDNGEFEEEYEKQPNEDNKQFFTRAYNDLCRAARIQPAKVQ